MKKWLLALVVALVMVLVCVGAGAEDYTLLINHLGTITGYTGTLPAELVLPDEIDGVKATGIGYNAFANCDSLVSVTIPEGIKEIYNSFSGCTALTSVTLPNSMTTIGPYSFQDCANLNNLTIPDNVTSIGNYAFSRCSSLTSLFIPNSVTSMGYNAFQGCSNLTTLSLGNGLTTISSSAFYSCKNLTSVIIPDSVSTIETFAFAYCTNLSRLSIPDSVTIVRADAFYQCTNLTDVYAQTVAGWLNTYFATEWANPMYYATQLHFTKEASGNYIIPDTVTSIRDYAFKDCADMKSIVIPDSVNRIGQSAFCRCSNLTSVIIPDSVTTIDSGAFVFCPNLTSISIGHGVTTLGASAFRNCDSLRQVFIPGSIATIPNYAFSGCDNLSSVAFGEGVQEIMFTSFENCKNLKSIVIPKSVTTIIGDAFFNNVPSPTIYCYASSYAETWAKQYKHKIVLLDNNTFADIGKLTLSEDAELMLGNTLKIAVALEPLLEVPVITWQSSKPSVATVDANGCVTPHTPGKTTITATVEGKSDSMVVTVWAPVDSFELNKTEVYTVVGNTVQLQIMNLQPELAADTPFTWSSSDTTYATVDQNGVVTTRSVGEVTITATSKNGVSRSCVIHMCYPVEGITLTQTNAVLAASETLQLNAQVVTRTETYANQLVTFRSTNEAVATVSDTGVVTALAHGRAQIIVSAMDNSDIYQVCDISVSGDSCTPTTVQGYAPTCTNTGLTDGTCCSICGQTLTTQEVIPATGHGLVISDRQLELTKGDALTLSSLAEGCEHLDEFVLTATPANAGLTVEGNALRATDVGYYTISLSIAVPDASTQEAIITALIHAQQTMTLPASLTEISEEAFMGAAAEEYILPNGMTAIGARAFTGSQVKLIAIPDSVTAIDDTAFEGCNVTFIAPADSYAESYAQAHGFPCITQ